MPGEIKKRLASDSHVGKPDGFRWPNARGFKATLDSGEVVTILDRKSNMIKVLTPDGSLDSVCLSRFRNILNPNGTEPTNENNE